MKLFALVQEQWPMWRAPLWAGSALAALGIALTLLPAAWPLQESTDLLWLFSGRQAKPSPREVAVISIDRRASDSLSLPSDPAQYHHCLNLRAGKPPRTHVALPPPRQLQRWPRCVYTQAIETLWRAGARVIVLDIQFSPRMAASPGEYKDLYDQQDRELAEVMARAGNVVVANALEKHAALQFVADHPSNEADSEDVAPLSPTIDEAVIGAAPFLVSKDVLGNTHRYTLFHQGEYPSASLPALAVHLYALEGHEDFVRLLKLIDQPYAELLAPTSQDLLAQRQLQATSLYIRGIFLRDRATTARFRDALQGTEGVSIPARRRAAVQMLHRLYSEVPRPYFSHYGPAGTLKTIGFEKLFEPARSTANTLEEVRDKIVVIGADYGEHQSDENHRTPLAGDGPGVNGAELAAVAIANLMSGPAVRPVGTGWRILIAAIFGFAVPILVIRFPFLRGMAIVAGLFAGYAVLAHVLFGTQNLWLPIAIPLLIQTPGGLVAGGIFHYLELQRQRARLRELFTQFLPNEVIDGLLKRNVAVTQDSTFGVCMYTDAENYTAIAETMHPDQLERFLNRYFAAIFPGLRQTGGAVSDVKGDSVLAVWTGKDDDAGARRNACVAALEIQQAIDQFNAESPGTRMPTLIGLNCGVLVRGLLGTGWHYESRPVGDTVNASERLQRLNKMLGTRILAAEAVVHGLEGLLMRDLGVFMLRGKSVPTHVFEIMGTRDTAESATLQLCLEFALALDAQRSGFREGALARFRAIRDRYPRDGPTSFYVRWISSHPEWDGGAIPQE